MNNYKIMTVTNPDTGEVAEIKFVMQATMFKRTCDKEGESRLQFDIPQAFQQVSQEVELWGSQPRVLEITVKPTDLVLDDA